MKSPPSFISAELSRNWTLVIVASSLLLSTGVAQESSKTTAASTSPSSERGVDLASQGRCREALPLLKKEAVQVTNKNLKFDILMSTAKCAMGLEQSETAVKAVLELNRNFPQDPQVLYLTTHYYSELAMRASRTLAETAPSSPQAQQLEAEAFESQGDWEKAIAEYEKILEQHPEQHGIHYRVGRIFLIKNPPDPESAKKELEEELKIDPNSAASEFLLGETARQAGQWDEAIARFSRVVKLDDGFDEAYLALGMSLSSAGKFSEAIAPLSSYVKRQPADPAGHYQLGTAYSRTGHQQEAKREMQLQQETAAKAPRTAAEQ